MRASHSPARVARAGPRKRSSDGATTRAPAWRTRSAPSNARCGSSTSGSATITNCSAGCAASQPAGRAHHDRDHGVLERRCLRCGGLQLPFEGAGLTGDERAQQRGLAREVAVQRGSRAAGLARDVVERGLGDSHPRDAGHGGVEQTRGDAVEGDAVGDQRFLQHSALLGTRVRENEGTGSRDSKPLNVSPSMCQTQAGRAANARGGRSRSPAPPRGCVFRERRLRGSRPGGRHHTRRRAPTQAKMPPRSSRRTREPTCSGSSRSKRPGAPMSESTDRAR